MLLKRNNNRSKEGGVAAWRGDKVVTLGTFEKYLPTERSYY
jgi:uncharacterized protein YjcR